MFSKPALMAVSIVVFCLFCAEPALAQEFQNADKEAGNVFGLILKILIHWLFPAMGLLCALYGLGRGMKRGEWDFFGMCLIAAIAVALTPTILESVMDLDFDKMMPGK